MEIKKPTFIIIGSAKCGTTALASILENHPNCCMSRPKEVAFFMDTIDYKSNNPNYDQGWDWYSQCFAHYNGEDIVGEATPSYSRREISPNTARKIHEFNPNMKIIYMVRNPLERQISAWKMNYTSSLDKSNPSIPNFDWANQGINYWMKKHKESGYWDAVRYGYQLAAYEEFFPIENICVSFLEDWKVSKDNELARIMNFLDIDPSLLPLSVNEKANKASDRVREKQWSKNIRSNKIAHYLIQNLPSSWRNWARRNLATTEIEYPSSEISPEILSSFKNYIADDIEDFLHRFNKDKRLWASCFK